MKTLSLKIIECIFKSLQNHLSIDMSIQKAQVKTNKLLMQMAFAQLVVQLTVELRIAGLNAATALDKFLTVF